MARTHYDVLGVAPTATGAEVRQAYVRLARVLHPDRGTTTGREMQELNESFRVLRDPAARAAYDRSLAPPVRPPSAARRVDQVDEDDIDDLDRPFHHPPAEPGDLTVRFVRGLPWLVILVVLGLIFVFTAYAGKDEGDGGFDWVGLCVDSQGGGTVEVPCSEPNDGRVDLVVQRQSQCPQGTSVLPEGEEWLCLRPVDETAP